MLLAPGRCSVVGAAAAADPTTAALVNGAAAHALDFDDNSYTGMIHGSAVIFPAALAAAEEVSGDGDRALLAFIAGSEAAYTLADIVQYPHYLRGWWSTATLGIVGATVAAARAYRLSAEATANAISMAAAGSGTTKCIFGTDSKPILAGEAARRAVGFAKMAAAGLRGPLDAFENKAGFFALLNNGECSFDHALSLGSIWRLQHPGVLIKSSPVCSAAHAPIEATAKLIREHDIRPNEIKTICCEISALIRQSLIYDEPHNPQEAQFSLPYAVACAALNGHLDLQDLAPAEIIRPTKRALMRRINSRVTAAPRIHGKVATSPEWAEVAIELRSGKVVKSFAGNPYGMPDNPMTDIDLLQKFASCVRFGCLDAPALLARHALTDGRCLDTLDVVALAKDVLQGSQAELT
jgi:2-methylcitrate dehydratase PrpD